MTNPVAVVHQVLDSMGAPIYQAVVVWCPGCESVHNFTIQSNIEGPVWAWDGNEERPSFEPSYLTWRGGEQREVGRCHSFLRNGRWQFLEDTNEHALRGFVDMVSLPDWLMDND